MPSIIDFFSEYLAKGENIKITLNSEEAIFGEIINFSADYIVILNSENRKRIINSKQIQDLEIIGSTEPAVNIETATAPKVETTAVPKNETVANISNSIDINTNPHKDNIKNEIIASIFNAPTTIKLPEIFLKNKEGNKEYSAEKSSIKSKYENAKRIKELNRILQILPELTELSYNTRDPELIYICGRLHHEVEKKEEASRFLEIASAKDNKAATISLSKIYFDDENWEKSIRFSITYLIDTHDASYEKPVLGLLGHSLSKIDSREFPGLGLLVIDGNDQDACKLYYAILALVFLDTDHNAASLALKGELPELREAYSASVIFSRPLKESLKEENKIVEKNKIEDKAENEKITGIVNIYYPERKYGFIKSNLGETYFFLETAVSDLDLLQDLTRCNTGQTVSFLETPKLIGRKYDQAEVIDWMQETTKTVHVDIPAKKSIPPLPKKDKIYLKAKLAEQRGDFKLTKELLQQVINNDGYYANSAIKDLAMLLNREDKTQEAISTIDKYRSRFTEKESLDNLKITFYIKEKNYKEVLSILEKQPHRVAVKLNNIMQRAYCTAMLGDYEKARLILNQAREKYPENKQIESYRKNILSPQYNDDIDLVKKLQNLEGLTSILSPFSRYLIDNCDFSGADERAKVKGIFAIKDFKDIERDFDRLGGRRPKEKAKLLITWAAMTEKSPDQAGHHVTHTLLSRALSFMGEAATYEKLPSDTIRYYLLESLALHNKVKIDHDHRYPLSFFMTSFLDTLPEPGELLSKGNYNFEGQLIKIENNPKALLAFKNSLPYYKFYAKNAIDKLLEIIRREAPSLFDSIEPQTQSKIEDKIKENEHELQISLTMLEDKDAYSTSTKFLETYTTLYKLTSLMNSELDKARTQKLAEISKNISSYWGERDYVLRESLYNRNKNSIDRFITDIKDSPTKLSFENLRVIANNQLDCLKTDFEKYILQTQVSLNLDNILSDDYYIPDNIGQIALKFSLRVNKGSAPVEGVDIMVHNTEDLTQVEPEISHYPSMLQSGDNKEIEVKIKPTGKSFSDETFSIKCFVTYRNRFGKVESTNDFSFPVRINSRTEFSLIENPYLDYSGGRSVEDPNMFKGRNEIIDKIIQVVGHGLPGQCFVLYGQKRSGKTSILYQVKRNLPSNHIALMVSLGEIDINHQTKSTNFIQLCIEKIDEYIEEMEGEASQKLPAKQEILSEPNASFRRTIKLLNEKLTRRGRDDVKIVLLVDEFTYVYEYIKEGSISPTFMRNWKALLQMGLFSAVVVGQDSMPSFKKEFSNEFGMTYDERISYLPRFECYQLAEDPIKYNNQSRYRGESLERLYDLTSGSPFYTNIICSKLVDYLNIKKAAFITEADIDAILHGWRTNEHEMSGLLSGADSLPIESFDPLITAAGESVAMIPRDDYLKVLSVIARYEDGNMLDINLSSIENYQLILTDMHEREVINVDTNGNYSICVKLFSEWLKMNNSVL